MPQLWLGNIPGTFDEPMVIRHFVQEGFPPPFKVVVRWGQGSSGLKQGVATWNREEDMSYCKTHELKWPDHTYCLMRLACHPEIWCHGITECNCLCVNMCFYMFVICYKLFHTFQNICNCVYVSVAHAVNVFCFKWYVGLV